MRSDPEAASTPSSAPVGRAGLARFLERHRARILREWETAVLELPKARELDRPELRDHIPELLDRIIASSLSGAEALCGHEPTIHAAHRLSEGFDLREVAAEYAILRRTILHILDGEPARPLPGELELLNEAIDEAVTTAVDSYHVARARTLDALDRISSTALAGSGSTAASLPALIKALLETTASVDAVVLLLAENDHLRVRATAGLDAAIVGGLDASIGTGFAGRIAAERRPSFLGEATSRDLELEPAIREAGLATLYGAPLVHGEDLVGVAYMASKSAAEFSDDDKQLFRAMTHRAAGLIKQQQLSDALRESEARFRETFDRSPIGIAHVALDGRFLRFNRGLPAMLGYTPEELHSLTFQEITHPEDLEADLAQVRRLEAGEISSYALEKRYLRKDRTFLWIRLSVSLLRDPAGRPVHYVAIVDDISERKQSEQALRASERRYALATRATADAVWDLDLRSGCITWNENLRTLFGYAPEDVGDIDFWADRLGLEDRERVVAGIQAAIDRGDAHWQDEYRFRRADGTYAFVVDRGYVDRDETGEAVRMVGAMQDVTERRRAEETQRFLSEATAVLADSLELAATFERIARLAVPRLADWCSVVLREGDQSLRQVAVAHVDPSKLEVVREMGRRYPPDPESPFGVGAAIRTGSPEVGSCVPDELLVRAAQDEDHLRMLRDLALRSYMIVPMVARGRVFGAINMATAESERRYGDADLELATHVARRAALAIDNARLYEEAREATRLREQVLAVVSHDLRNPLGALQLAAQLLADRVETSGVESSARKQVQVILRSSKRMERLIADLLDVASLQAGRFAVEVGQEEVGSLVDEAVETMSARAREQSISLSGRVFGRRDVRVRADRARILQVFGNLIGNALKFCRPGDHVDVRAEPGEGVCIFSVQDDGPGITDDDLPHLFDPYWSAKRHARRGTGLGLYISRGIVEAHRGRIWVETTLGAGSTFLFSLPVAEGQPAPEQR